MAKKKKRKKPLGPMDEEQDYDKGSLYILKRLFQYVRGSNKNLLYPLIISIVLNIIFSWFTPLIFQILVDEGLGGGITGGAGTGDVGLIINLGILFFIFTIAGVISRIVQGYIISKYATLTMYNLRYELFIKFQKLGLDYHEGPNKTTGKKINYLTGDVNTIQELVQSGLLMVIGNFFLVFGALIFMIILSGELTLISFLLVPIVFGIGGFIFKKARKYFKELRERVANVTSQLDESIMGMRIVQAFAVEDENYNEFINRTELERQTTLKSAKLMAYIPGIIMFVITIGLGVLFFSAGVLIRGGSMTQGTLVAFIFYIFMFFEPLFSLLGFFTLLQNSIAAGNRIIRLIDEEPSIQEKSDAIELKGIKGKIAYRNVNFYYEENIPVLKNINITIKEKERLAIVGYTGAGKSTFIKLLSRFYDPNEGNIEIDDIDLKDVKLKNLRMSMGIVMQENFLFSGTIMENIRYGKLDATDEEVTAAAKKVNAHDFILELENGYDTKVGERGGRLSEGQRQLIAFARALIADPPILILDEATSSIDPYSELLIQQALETLLKGRTSISIAHRLSTILNSDRIVVLDKGQIIEEGSHQELVDKKGFYNHLYSMQFKDPFKKENGIEKEDIELIDIKRDSYDNKYSRFM
jgi:ATP-binding cassette subfamily B protein